MTNRFMIEIDEENIAHILDNGTDIGQYNLCKLLNAFNDENEFLKELLGKLEEFEVFESDRISGAVVTNNEYSVTLHKSSEAYMVCDMINRFIRGVKNGSKD